MYEIAVKDVSDEANDASDSDERDDLRLLPKLLPAKPGFIWTRVLLLLLQPNAEILCQAAGSIICYGLLGYSKIFLLISGDCRCRWGMTSRSWVVVVVVVVLAVAAEDAAASGQMSCLERDDTGVVVFLLHRVTGLCDCACVCVVFRGRVGLGFLRKNRKEDSGF